MEEAAGAAPPPAASRRLALYGQVAMVLGALLLATVFVLPILGSGRGVAFLPFVGLVLLALGYLLHRSARRLAGQASVQASPKPPLDPRRRQVALALVAVGAIALLALFFALPRIHGFELQCEPEATAQHLADADWVAVRTPQLEGQAPRYDEALHVTYIVPGCGHGTAGLALRVAGDQRAFVRGPDGPGILLLAPSGVDGTLEPMPSDPQANASAGPGCSMPCSPPRVLAGSFEVASMATHLALFTVGIALAPAGWGLLRRGSHWAFGLAPALGALAGWFVVHMLAAGAGGGLFLLFIGAPVLLVMPLLVGVLGMAFSRAHPNRWLAFAAFLAYAAAYVLSLVAFIEAFPQDPLA